MVKVKSWILARVPVSTESQNSVLLGKLSYKFFTGTILGLACLETQEEENALFELKNGFLLIFFFQQVNCQNVKRELCQRHE